MRGVVMSGNIFSWVRMDNPWIVVLMIITALITLSLMICVVLDNFIIGDLCRVGYHTLHNQVLVQA